MPINLSFSLIHCVNINNIAYQADLPILPIAIIHGFPFLYRMSPDVIGNQFLENNYQTW